MPRISHARIFSVVATALALAGAMFAAPALAQEPVMLKVHHFLPPGSTIHAKFLLPWCAKLEKESSGKMKCQIYPAMQMGGNPTQLYDQAKDGVADIVWTLLGYNPGRFTRAEAFEVPFMVQDNVGASKALWDYVDQVDRDEFKDVKPLAFHLNGDAVIHMVKHPIMTQADFKGLKIRAATRQANKFIAILGATPVGMPVPQVPDSLSKGVIDGVFLPYEVVPSLKVQEIAKYHSETDPSEPAVQTSAFVLAMNPAKYASLSPELKKVIDANSGQALSAQMGQIFVDANNANKQVTLSNRHNTIPKAEVEKWEKLALPVSDSWISEVNAKGGDGKKLLEQAKALIAKYSAK
ncbi:MAG: C4-dicarboxylate transporter [Betaproteobacteria bacterium]|nr:C4-dicarboxylate transporter [Betaproteobacteria bacterium]